jgi:methylmalonyl-CoA mutase N-terminal domain/subunit
MIQRAPKDVRPAPAPVLNDSGIPLRAAYGPSDVAPGLASRLGEPGGYPFTRGLHPQGYRLQPWTMRQYAGFGTARETNERFKTLLAQGQTGLSVAFDLPTQIGYDSDHPLAEGEVGRVGVAIDSLADMEVLFADLPLERISTSMTINATAPILLAMYVALAAKQGVPLDRLAGTTQNDILKEYVARGTWIFPPRPSLRLAVDLIAYAAQHLPRWNPISCSGYHIRDAGATAVQEMAFAVANALAYVEATLARGVAIDTFAPRISWIFNTHNDFFQEIAKFRALRRMWARLMRERYGAENPRSWMLRTHSQTGGVTLPAQQPENNVARAAFQAMAAALGGVQSLALSCYDEALALPTDFAQQLALRTQQILAHETGIRRVADPLGGSWYVEWLTDRLEAEALEQLAQIERLGGAVAAIEQRRMQRAIEAAAWAEQRAVEAGERVVVGVNRYAETGNGHGPGLQGELFRLDAAASTRQCEALARLRRERDGGAVAARLAALRCAAADAAANLMPVILDAVRVYATVGEISDALRDVFGVHRERN